ncbi:MAG: DUF2628 domain-containing protein [Betaproteobacteria bacterium]
MSASPEHVEYHGDFTIVARSLEPTEAHLLKSYLESCSIPAIVADANLVQAAPFLTGPVGGASVRVPKDFAPEALDLIAKFNRIDVQADSLSDDAVDLPLEKSGIAGARKLKTYGVYTHPDKPIPLVVKAGFSWGAFIFGPLWFLLNRMWLNFFLVTTLYVGGNLYFRFHQVDADLGAPLFIGMYFLYLLLWFLIGKFANSLLAADLEDRGYKRIATVMAENPAYAREEAAKRLAGDSAAQG